MGRPRSFCVLRRLSDDHAVLNRREGNILEALVVFAEIRHRHGMEAGIHVQDFACA